jgi:hypothetical protein
MQLVRFRLSALLVLVVLAAACGAPGGAPTLAPASAPVGGYPGWPPAVRSFEIIPIPVSTELVVGQNRLLVNLIDKTNEPLASADLPVEFRLYNLAADATNPAVTVAGTYLQTIAGRPGLYRASVTFDKAGEWGLEAVATATDGTKRSGRFTFDVAQTGSTPAIGAQAPTSETPTAQTSTDVSKISTDDDPDADFYKVSEPDALAAHDPFVIIFATPAFCKTATCGPALDLTKSVAADYKGRLTFIHVEPYKLQIADGHLQPVLTSDNLPVPVDATNIWGLTTEPYIFVVDSAGKVAAKFEGIASDQELRAAFDAVATK